VSREYLWQVRNCANRMIACLVGNETESSCGFCHLSQPSRAVFVDAPSGRRSQGRATRQSKSQTFDALKVTELMLSFRYGMLQTPKDIIKLVTALLLFLFLRSAVKRAENVIELVAPLSAFAGLLLLLWFCWTWVGSGIEAGMGAAFFACQLWRFGLGCCWG